MNDAFIFASHFMSRDYFRGVATININGKCHTTSTTIMKCQKDNGKMFPLLFSLTPPLGTRFRHRWIKAPRDLEKIQNANRKCRSGYFV